MQSELEFSPPRNKICSFWVWRCQMYIKDNW